jgi:hypothetical protein
MDAKPIQTLNRFSGDPFYGYCDSCERKVSKVLLIHDGGFLLCGPCKEYMDRKYEELRKEEEIWP